MGKWICIACACVIATAACAGTPINETRPLEPRGTVHVSNTKGSIEITGWDRDEVEITGTLGTGVIRLDVIGDARSLRIEVIGPRNWRNVQDSHLIVKAPRNAVVNSTGVSARLALSGIEGDIRAKTVSGSIRINGGSGMVSAEAVSGSIEVNAEAVNVEATTVSGSVSVNAPAQRLRANTVSGGITISRAGGEVALSTVSGGIRIDGTEYQELRASTTSGSIRVKGALGDRGRMQCETHSGSIEVTFTEPPSARFDLSSFSGSLRADIPGAEGLSGRRTLTFSTGDALGAVNLRSFSSSVRVLH